MSVSRVFQRLVFGGVVVAVAAVVAAEMERGAATAEADRAADAHVRAPVSFEDDGHGTAGKVDVSRIESAAVVTHVEVVAGDQRPRIVLLDPDGAVVYESDPTTNTTVLAKDVIIPSVTVRETDDAVAELRVVTAAKPVAAPVELQEALTAELDEPVGMFYREDL